MKLRPYFYVVATLAAVGLLVAPQLIVAAPREATMGLVYKIFFYHVPVATVTFIATFVCAWGSVKFLFKGSEEGDRLAVSAAELTVLFGLLTLVTGPLWARKAWGVWWQWDVRLTTTVLLWFIFIAYLFARKYGGPGARRLCAGLALFGAADVPLIYFSVSIWRTIHPKATVVSGIIKSPNGMGKPLLFGFIAMVSLFLALLEMRVALERARARVDELHLEAEDAGLED
jgi:heme exporter protein C